jgi:ATP-dependent Zn protease
MDFFLFRNNIWFFFSFFLIAVSFSPSEDEKNNQNFPFDRNFLWGDLGVPGGVFAALVGFFGLYKISDYLLSKSFWKKEASDNLIDKLGSELFFQKNNNNEKYIASLIKKNYKVYSLSSNGNLHLYAEKMQSFLKKFYSQAIEMIKNKYHAGMNIYIMKSPYKQQEEEFDEYSMVKVLQESFDFKNVYYINLINGLANKDLFLKILEKKLQQEKSIYVIDKESIHYLLSLIKHKRDKIIYDEITFLNYVCNLFERYKQSILLLEFSSENNAPQILLPEKQLVFFEYQGVHSVQKLNIILFLLQLEKVQAPSLDSQEISELIFFCEKFTFSDIVQLIDRILFLQKKNISYHDLVMIFSDFLAHQASHDSKRELKESSDVVREHITSSSFSFENIIGYDDLKITLKKIIENVRRKITKKLPGLILYGPPGTGKTQIVKAIGNSLKIPIIPLTAAHISKYSGMAEKNLTEIFNRAKENSPCIVFIDEGDGILARRSEDHDPTIMNHFLGLLDGLEEMKGVFVIVTTNNIEAIEPAALRPGRISKKVYVPLPNYQDREKLCSYYMTQNSLEIANRDQYSAMINQLEGFSCADIKYFFEFIGDEYAILSHQNHQNFVKSLTSNQVTEFYRDFLKQTNSNEGNFKYYDKSNFNSIAGYEDIKEDLYDVLEELKGQYTKKTKLEGIIFTGGPGMGKTQFAKALAGEAKIPMLTLEAKDILNPYVGRSEEKIYNLFQSLRKNSPCILFIDEIDGLFGLRNNNSNKSSYMDNVVNLFLQHIDGINPLKGVLFIGATNNISKLDPAIVRPGRMSHIITIDYPSLSDRQKILQMYIQEEEIVLDCDIKLDYLAERLDGFSSAEIKRYVVIMKKLLKKEHGEMISKKIATEAYQQIILGKKNSKIKQSKQTIVNTAYHEASHGLLQYICHRQSESPYEFDFLTIIPRASALGIAFMKKESEYKDLTKEKMLGLLAINLAGKAGEKVFSNIVSAGPSSDLEHAFETVKSMVLRYGMGKKLIYRNEKEWLEEINSKLEKQYEKLITFLTEHKELVEKIVQEVVLHETLYVDDMEKIVTSYEQKNNKKVYFPVSI